MIAGEYFWGTLKIVFVIMAVDRAAWGWGCSRCGASASSGQIRGGRGGERGGALREGGRGVGRVIAGGWLLY
jgi:hypothetical protein